MAARVSPTEAIRAEIHELFASDGELLSVLEQVARLSVRLTFQSVVEEIVCEELGRDRYQRRREDSPEGYRNGWHQPRTLKTAAGPVQLQRPKLRHAHAALCDQLFGAGVSRTNALETLVISCWVRGLSDRDVEAMLVEVFGQQATISRTTVSRICQRLRAEFDAWARDYAAVLKSQDDALKRVAAAEKKVLNAKNAKARQQAVAELHREQQAYQNMLRGMKSFDQKMLRAMSGRR